MTCLRMERRGDGGQVSGYTKRPGLKLQFIRIVKGTIAVGEDKKESNLSRTVTINVKDVGSTKLTLPTEATSKL